MKQLISRRSFLKAAGAHYGRCCRESGRTRCVCMLPRQL